MTEEALYDLADLFKLFGDSTRLRILFTLFEKDRCVGDIAALLDMTQSAVSHQLKILRDGKLIKSTRDGKSIIYSLADNHVKSIIGMGMDHIVE